MTVRLSRREALALGAGLALFSPAGAASALGRTPYGGRLKLSLPWSLSSIDPHDLGDPAAALFGAALFDSLFSIDSHGVISPVLADALPLTDGGGLIVKLRPGLKTAKGAGIDARDVVASLGRAKKLGAGSFFARFGVPSVAPHDNLAVAFAPGRAVGAADRYGLARALASAASAIVPRGFDPRSPDGTGPFEARLAAGGLALSRNLNAARGASFLERIEIARANDLVESLRAFEAERDDLGWLGTGLYGSRKNAARFDLGRVAWIMLSTTSGLGEHGAPGRAQALADGLPRDSLGHLGLGPLPPGKPTAPWTGPPTDLLVDKDAPHLVEVAEAVAAVLTNPDHEVTVRALGRAEVIQKRRRGDAALALGVARPLGLSTLETLVALASFDDPARANEIVKSPPKLASEGPRALTSTLRSGVLGELRISGAALPDLALEPADGGGWDLGASFLRPKKPAP